MSNIFPHFKIILDRTWAPPSKLFLPRRTTDCQLNVFFRKGKRVIWAPAIFGRGETGSQWAWLLFSNWPCPLFSSNRFSVYLLGCYHFFFKLFSIKILLYIFFKAIDKLIFLYSKHFSIVDLRFSHYLRTKVVLATQLFEILRPIRKQKKALNEK